MLGCICWVRSCSLLMDGQPGVGRSLSAWLRLSSSADASQRWSDHRLLADCGQLSIDFDQRSTTLELFCLLAFAVVQLPKILLVLSVAVTKALQDFGRELDFQKCPQRSHLATLNSRTRTMQKQWVSKTIQESSLYDLLLWSIETWGALKLILIIQG